MYPIHEFKKFDENIQPILSQYGAPNIVVNAVAELVMSTLGNQKEYQEPNPGDLNRLTMLILGTGLMLGTVSHKMSIIAIFGHKQ